MGILDASLQAPDALTPQAQGILKAAFALMAAGAPSRLPTGFGEALGKAGTAGVAGYEDARKAQLTSALQALQAKKLESDLRLQDAATQGGSDSLINPDSDPDKLEALGMRLAAAGHPGGAALVNTATKIREKKAQEAQVKSFQGADLPAAGSEEVGVSPTDEEALRRVALASDQGRTATIAVDNAKGGEGLFGSLINSPIPAIAAQARSAQGIINSQKGAAIPPQHWLDLQKSLASQEATLVARENNLPKSEHVVQDKSSPTGWSYEDTRNGRRTLGAPPPSSSAATNVSDVIPASARDLHGDDYLATLPSGMQNIVKGIAKGEVSINNASMRYGNREAMVARVKQFDPTYTDQRFKVVSGFKDPNGKTGQNIVAINQSIAHAGTLYDLADAMKNGNLQQVNKLVSLIRDQTGDMRINNADLAAQALSNELMRVFRQVNASESETKQFEEKLNAAKRSPQQMLGALQTGAKLLFGRINALQDQYHRGTGLEDDFPILGKESQRVLGKLGIVGNGIPLQTSNTPPQQRVRKWNPATQRLE